MQQYIMRRTIQMVESMPISAESFDDASMQLKEFMSSQVPFTGAVVKDKCHLEYTGEQDGK